MSDDLKIFVFKRSNHHYLVPAESEDDAWTQLANRQSMSVKRCKLEYHLLGIIKENSEIWKI